MQISNYEKRKILELKNIADKIERNKQHRLSTEKLETDFGRIINQLKANGYSISDIRNAVNGTEKNTDCVKCPHCYYCPNAETENKCKN